MTLTDQPKLAGSEPRVVNNEDRVSGVNVLESAIVHSVITRQREKGMGTCETELVEVVFVCYGTVGDTVDQRAENGAPAGLVDAEDVGAICGGCAGVVSVRMGGHGW